MARGRWSITRASTDKDDTWGDVQATATFEEEEDDVRKLNAFKKKAKLPRSQTSMKLMAKESFSFAWTFMGFRRSSSLLEDDDDIEDRLSPPATPTRTSSRKSTFASFKTRQDQKLSQEDLSNIREDLICWLGPLPGRPESLWFRFQRFSGLLELRLRIGIKQMRVEREPPQWELFRDIDRSLNFEMVIAALIILNGITLAVDLMYREGEKKPGTLALAENLFVFIFLVEWQIRILSNSLAWVCDPINAFDTFIVWGPGVIVTWILIPLEVDADILRKIGALRVLRIGRVVRAVRILPALRSLWTFVCGMMSCLRLIFWMAVIITAVLFMFAVAAREVVARSASFAGDDLVQSHFGDLGNSMFTLFQIMTFDSWSLIVRPILSRNIAAGVLFLLFIGVAGLILMNLMTAVVLQHTFDQAEADAEGQAQKKNAYRYKMVKQLHKIFRDLDEDGSGTLTREEFDVFASDRRLVAVMAMLEIDVDELSEIFDILEVNGTITEKAFIRGTFRMHGKIQSRDMLKAGVRLQRAAEDYEDLQEVVSMHTQRWDDVEEGLDFIHDYVDEAQLMMAELVGQLDGKGLRYVFRNTMERLPEMPEPTEDEASEKDLLGRKARGKSWQLEELAKTAARPPADGRAREVANPLPQAWVARHRRQMRRRGRQEARRQQAMKPGATGEPAEAFIPGMENSCAKEFKEEWERLQVKLPRESESAVFGRLRRAADADRKAFYEDPNRPRPPPKHAFTPLDNLAWSLQLWQKAPTPPAQPTPLAPPAPPAPPAAPAPPQDLQDAMAIPGLLPHALADG